MTHTRSDLIQALRRAGLRITAPRRAICTALADSAGEHVGAGDILERARRVADGGVNESTVYRTLDTFEQLGILRHVHLGHGPGVYHFVDEQPHHHLVCERCGKSVDVPLADVRPLLKMVAAKHGFNAEGMHFALSGLCEDCRPEQLKP